VKGVVFRSEYPINGVAIRKETQGGAKPAPRNCDLGRKKGALKKEFDKAQEDGLRESLGR